MYGGVSTYLRSLDYTRTSLTVDLDDLLDGMAVVVVSFPLSGYYRLSMKLCKIDC